VVKFKKGVLNAQVKDKKQYQKKILQNWHR